MVFDSLQSTHWDRFTPGHTCAKKSYFILHPYSQLTDAKSEDKGRSNKASLLAQLVKKLPAVQETWVQSLGREDPLEKEMATHSSILAWEIPWTEEPGGLQSMGLQELDMT